MKDYHVFISYSREDDTNFGNDTTDLSPIGQILKRFENAHIRPWIDREGKYIGENYLKEIVKGIDNSEMMLFVSSKNSNNSYYALKEVCYAADKKMKILPLLLDDTPFSEEIKLLFSAKDKRWFYPNTSKTLDELTENIKNHLDNIAQKEREKAEAEEAERRRKEEEKERKRIEAEEKKRIAKLEKKNENIKKRNFIFISYSSKDKCVADALCHYLEENDIPVWIAPRDILAGQSWAGAIVQAIRECSAMVLIYSVESNSSHQVANEIDKAFSCAKTIIPFIVDSTPMNDDFDYYLSRKHWLIAYPDYKDKLKPLLDNLIKLIPDLQYDITERILPTDYMQNGMVNDSLELEGQNNHNNNIVETKITETVSKSENVQNVLQPHWADNTTDEMKEIIQGILDNMVLVEGGTFVMGATPEQKRWACKDERPAHKVTLSSYYICKYLVTQKEWRTIMGNNPSKRIGDKKAVDNVSKLDCDEFVSVLQHHSGINFNLPTEAQWEFAARGGNLSHGYIYSGGDVLEEVGWYSCGDHRHMEVGMKIPNELGIYDMSGYVSEWCCEEKGKYTERTVVDPKSIYEVHWLNQGSYVLRGGDYLFKKKCRVSYRSCFSDGYKSSTIGCRLVITAELKIN